MNVIDSTAEEMMESKQRTDRWTLIQAKARLQEDVDDSCLLTMVDVGKPMYTGRAEYRLTNIVSQRSI